MRVLFLSWSISSGQPQRSSVHAPVAGLDAGWSDRESSRP